MTVRTAPKTTPNEIRSRHREAAISGVGRDVALHRKKSFSRSRQNRQNYLPPAVSKETKLLNSSGERLPTGRIALDRWAFLFSAVDAPGRRSLMVAWAAVPLRESIPGLALAASLARGRRCRRQ